MKHFLALLFVTALFILAPFASRASAEGMIPQSIQAFFEAPSFEGAVILAQDELTEYGADDCRFILIRTKSGENVLYCFKQESGDWKEQFHTSGAVPQTSHGVQMHIALSGVEWITDERFDTPRLYIGQEDKEGEYWEWTITYELQNGKWMLRRIYSYIGYDSMLIQDGSISYYREIESNRIAGTAKGVFQRDIRYVNLSAIPKTLAEARAKLTVAPALPESAELRAYPVTFAGNQKYDVYSAPDAQSIRGANGKAKVSTNSWIQVFGTEGEWTLIHYSIDAAHYRFGYISKKALPKKAAVPDLPFRRTDAWTTAAVPLTDDPLYSRAVLLSLPKGARVTWLASMDEWAYVEVNENDLARGFVPLSAITADRVFDLRSQPGDDGQAVYEGTLTVTQDDRLEANLSIPAGSPLAGFPVYRVRVLDTMSGSLLTLLRPDDNGSFFGDCGLGGDVTSVTLCAVGEDGSAAPASVRVEW